MKPFVCEKCKKHWATEEESKKCEAGHPTPVSIVAFQDYISDKTENYPNRILIEFSDGKRAYYSYDALAELLAPNSK